MTTATSIRRQVVYGEEAITGDDVQVRYSNLALIVDDAAVMLLSAWLLDGHTNTLYLHINTPHLHPGPVHPG